MTGQHSHLPSGDRHTPISTYRLQLSSEFTFEDARKHLGYWRDLGITDLFLSPFCKQFPALCTAMT